MQLDDGPKEGDIVLCRDSFQPIPVLRRIEFDGDRVFLHPLDGVGEIWEHPINAVIVVLIYLVD